MKVVLCIDLLAFVQSDDACSMRWSTAQQDRTARWCTVAKTVLTAVSTSNIITSILTVPLPLCSFAKPACGTSYYQPATVRQPYCADAMSCAHAEVEVRERVGCVLDGLISLLPQEVRPRQRRRISVQFLNKKQCKIWKRDY